MTVLKSDLIQLNINHPYPIPLEGRGGGASAQFLWGGPSFLEIAIPHVRSSEAKLVQTAKLEVGFLNDGPLILWIFQFGDLIFDCPFDARLIDLDKLELPNLTDREQRFSFHVFLVDTSTKVLRGLRAVTLSPVLTRAFFSAVHDQLADARSQEPFLRKYYAIPLADLARQVALPKCGQ